MFDFKPISLVLGFLICSTGFFLSVPLITEIIYKTDQWQAYAVPLIVYLVVGGSYPATILRGYYFDGGGA